MSVPGPVASRPIGEAAWSAALDEIEASLREVDVRVGPLAAGAPGVDELPGAWVAPSGLGPIPAALVPRARAVLDAIGAATAAVATARDAVRTELGHLDDAARLTRPRRPPADEPPTPRLVDHSA